MNYTIKFNVLNYNNKLVSIQQDGGPKKFNSIEECENYINDNLINHCDNAKNKTFFIYQGWNKIKEIKVGA